MAEKITYDTIAAPCLVPRWHGQGVADWKCNKCGMVVQRDLGLKTWTPSYCEKTGKHARLYRISSPNNKL